MLPRLASRPRATSLLDWALHYGERGWPVLPLVPRSKRPLTASGLLDASANRHQIREWWLHWPNANIGLRTGVQFDVLDVDGDAGRQSIAAKVGPEYGHSGPISLTGRGEHWLFLPGGTANRAGLLTKVDWRGTNGYIVAPPSIHPEGHRYAWHPDHDLNRPLEPVPAWLAPLLLTYVERTYEPTTIRANQYSQSIVSIAEGLGHALHYGGGGRYNIECPFHDGDREPSLVLYPDSNSFYCFGCGAWGDRLALIEGRPRYRNADRR